MDMFTEGVHALFGHMDTLMEHGRRLDKKEFETASTIAQVFSGSLFSSLCLYLLFSNSTRMAYIHRASIEKRLTYCCHINTIVAAISAMLNLYQLTDVDNWKLPRNKSEAYSVDTSRPIEWILTCPLMQLSLVLMGGPKIPDYRRTLMPSLAAIVLFFGSATLFFEQVYVVAPLYACAACTHMTAMYFNRLQIIEHSRGAEGLFTGDSEFRRATLILMLTWFPFPCWMMLSPEGFNVVTSVTIIQMGWACLNITSKFTLIFYIQRIKDNYTNRLKVQRSLGDQGAGGMYRDPIEDEDSDGDMSRLKPIDKQLRGCLQETMNFLGMLENADRFSKLLQQANITTLEEVAVLSREDCIKLQLPWELVNALQTRQRTWALELVDEAEIGLERGEKFYSIAPEAMSPREKTKGRSRIEFEFNEKPFPQEFPAQRNSMQGNVMLANTVPGNMMPGSMMPGGMSMSPMAQTPTPAYPMDLDTQMNMQMMHGNMMNGNVNMVPMSPMSQIPHTAIVQAESPMNEHGAITPSQMYANVQANAKTPPGEDQKRDRATSMTMLPRPQSAHERADRATSMTMLPPWPQSRDRERSRETRIPIYDRSGDVYDRNDRNFREVSDRDEVSEQKRLAREMSRSMDMQRDMARDLTDVSQRMTRDVAREMSDVSQRMAHDQNSFIVEMMSRQQNDNTLILETLDKKLADQNTLIVDMVSRQQQDNTLLLDMLGKKLGELETNMWDKVSERVDFMSQNMGKHIESSQHDILNGGIQDMSKSLEKLQLSMEKSHAVLEAKVQCALPAAHSPYQDHERREQERREQDRLREQERREQERREQERREQERKDQERREQERQDRERRDHERRARSEDQDRRVFREDSGNNANLMNSIKIHVEQCLAQSVEKILQTSSAIEDSNAASFRSMENMLIDVFEKLDLVKTSQQTLLSSFGGGSITDMTDGLSKNIIHQVAQENKANAFTLQARMTLIDETQGKKLSELEERLGQMFQHIVKESTTGLHNLVNQQSQVSADKVCGALESWKAASSNDSIRIEQKISDLATYINQESSKHIEASLAVFGSTLRVQLDTMHTAQLGLHRDSDSSVTTKLQSFFSDMHRKIEKIDMFESVVKDVMQQLSQEQIEKISMLSANIREFMRYQGGRNSMSGNDDGNGSRGIEWTLNRLTSVADQPPQPSPNRTERPGTANSTTRPRSSGTGGRMTFTS